eukprot:TRINITY_DN8453_c0_g1_i1.p1 TRINITY_DN8453_c0_g1~~TRINITY_DN8453_c0_g1_i1.p1  ORF type:complete len:282 (-),score=34.65 TRINITY_DN8453_c0_g1_i1:31-876(-)
MAKPLRTPLPDLLITLHLDALPQWALKERTSLFEKVLETVVVAPAELHQISPEHLFVLLSSLCESMSNKTFVASTGDVDTLCKWIEANYQKADEIAALLVRFPRELLSSKVELQSWRFLAQNFRPEHVPVRDLVAAFSRHIEREDTAIASLTTDLRSLELPQARHFFAELGADTATDTGNVFNATTCIVTVKVPAHARDLFARVTYNVTGYFGGTLGSEVYVCTHVLANKKVVKESCRIIPGSKYGNCTASCIVKLDANTAYTFELLYRTPNLDVFLEGWA